MRFKIECNEKFISLLEWPDRFLVYTQIPIPSPVSYECNDKEEQEILEAQEDFVFWFRQYTKANTSVFIFKKYMERVKCTLYYWNTEVYVEDGVTVIYLRYEREPLYSVNYIN